MTSVPGSLATAASRIARNWAELGSADDLHRCIVGSVVLVDVSGFTKMSERLARFGRVGAEHVTEVIGSRFGELLVDAYDYGATLLKFGGDALTLFFDGPEHERRAAAAAFEMRATLRRIATFTTEAGTVTLRMTVGVYSGPFDFFLVGGSHRELVVAGPSATAAVDIDGAAATGQILLGPATAAALARQNVGRRVGPGFLLRGEVGEPRIGVPPLEPITRDLSYLVPVGLRDALTDPDNQPEHRRVTIAFLHYGGLDTLVARAPAEAGRRLDALVRTVQQAIDARGVCFLATDIAPDGGKIILTAGAPHATGHDEEQMLLALRAIMEREPPLPLRVGVNSGAVFAGDIGAKYRRYYTVMGDAVNVAARVMGRATHDEILATDAVLDASRTLFDTRALEPFAVKGKRLPVIAHSVGAARGVRTEVAGFELPFLGRDSDLNRVLPLLEGLPAGTGGVIEIVGDPGSGKSRFLREIERCAAGVPVRRAQCRLYQATTPYFPIGQVLEEITGVDAGSDEAATRLEQLVSASAPDLRPWLSLLGVPLGLDIADSDAAAALDDAFRRQRTEEVVVQLLGGLLTEPTIMVFEDTHWMDDASGDLVRALARASTDRPWLICLARRSVASGLVLEASDGVERVVLEPLDREATTQLVLAATRDSPLAQHVAAGLVDRADGNPLFLLELLSALRDGSDVSELPSTIEGLISARVDRLAADDRARLRRVAVLGAMFHVGYFGAVDADDVAVEHSLTRLQEFLAVDDAGWVRFRHALVRDVAYAGLPFRTRRRLHGQIADSMLERADGTGEGDASLLSLHFFQAQRYEETWNYARIAADAARDVYANVEAAKLYRRALDAVRNCDGVDTEAQASVLESLGDVQDRGGLLVDSRVSYAAARKLLTGDRPATARVMLKEAFVAERRGRYADAVRVIRRAERLLEPVTGNAADRLRAQLSVWLAAIRASQGSIERAIEAATEGITRAEASGDHDARARGLLVLDFALAASDRNHSWFATKEALDIYIDLGDIAGEATAANNLGVAAYYDGRWSDAVQWYTRARAARVRLGDPVNAAMSDANIAEIRADQGRFDEADELLSDAESVWIAADDSWGIAFSRRLRGVVAARDARFTVATELLDDSRAICERIGAKLDLAQTELAVVDLLLREARPSPALAQLDRLAALPGAIELLGPALPRLRAVALVQAGAHAQARVQFDLALAAARENGTDYDVVTVMQAFEQAAPIIGAGPNEHQRAEAAEHLRRLEVILVSAYPLQGLPLKE